MNAQEYIASGLLEAYVYGSLSGAEAAEVARAIVQYPEVKAEVAAIEDTLFLLASADAITPPAPLKNQIWDAIQAGKGFENRAPVTDPVIAVPQQQNTVKIVPADVRTGKRSWAIAASLVALAGSLAANYFLYNNQQQAGQHALALQQQLDTISLRQEKLAALVSRYQHESEMMSDPDMKPVVMQTTQKTQPMAATIYWSKSKSMAYVSVQKLPMPPAGMQYQLWAIADGKPVDLGVLDNRMIGTSGMEKVNKAVIDGQAFAISLEKEGGSPSPTMDKIFVMGKVI